MLNVRLGKAPKKTDARTFQLRGLLQKGLPVPSSYNFDANKAIPTPMFLNDQYGDCVIAGRAHQTLRFERTEQGKIITIRDNDVLTEYMKQTGGKDSGLVVLDSLNAWRKGWTLGDRQCYTIYAYAEVNVKNHEEVKAAICYLTGIGAGLMLPLYAQDQFERGKKWAINWFGNKRLWGGHYVHIPAYNKTGPICITWGQRQQMTWAFWDRFCDEAYVIVDNKDKWVANSPIDPVKLDALLHLIAVGA